MSLCSLYDTGLKDTQCCQRFKNKNNILLTKLFEAILSSGYKHTIIYFITNIMLLGMLYIIISIYIF